METFVYDNSSATINYIHNNVYDMFRYLTTEDTLFVIAGANNLGYKTQFNREPAKDIYRQFNGLATFKSTQALSM